LPIEWSDTFAVGIAEIDRQHRALIDQFNELMGAMQASKGKLAIEKMLAFLGDYVVMHFQTEEALMLQHGYPGYEGHRTQHRGFVKTLEGLKAEFERTGPTSMLAIAVNAKVGGWLVRHVLNADQELGRFLRERKAS